MTESQDDNNGAKGYANHHYYRVGVVEYDGSCHFLELHIIQIQDRCEADDDVTLIKECDKPCEEKFILFVLDELVRFSRSTKASQK